MPASGSYVNTSALFRAAVPKQSYAQLSAQKDQEMYQGAITEEKARLAQQQNQVLIQQQQEYRNKIKNLPLEAPDKQRVRLWVKEKERELANHIADRYANREDEFFATESESWMRNTMNDLLGSDLYQIAEANKENVFLAKQAMNKQENLTGEFTEDGKYVPAENRLLDFMSGKNPVFKFNGSYKPDAQYVYDHFGKQDNPYGSKYDRNAYVPDKDVLNVLSGTMGDKNGRDMFYRSFMGRQVPYKRYSVEDQIDFNTDIANKQSTIAARKASTAQGWARIDLQRQKLAKDDQADAEIAGQMATIVGNPIGITPFQPITKPLNQKLTTIGKSVGELITPGKTKGARQFEQISGLNLGAGAGLEFTEYSGMTLGPMHEKYANLNRTNGKLKEGITADGEVLDMSKIPHRIVSVNPNIFVDQAETNRIGEQSRVAGKTIYPDHEFRKTTVFVPLAQVQANNIDITGAKPQTKKDPEDENKIITEGYYIDLMSPSKGFFNNKEVQHLLNKGELGLKTANDIRNQPSDEFQSANDDLLDN